MNRLQSMKTQFLMMMIGASMITMICIGVVFIEALLSNTETKVEEFRAQLVEDVERELKIQTETAVSFIDQVYKRQQAGLLTEEQAKTEAAAFVRDLRYDDGAGYFWIDTFDGVNVALLGRQATEGKSRINSQDPTGKYFIKEMIENGRKPGGGYTDLMFAKPNQTEPLPKRNYTLAFEPYKWVIGTGIWIDYIDGKVAEMQATADEEFKETVILVVVVVVVLEIILIIISNILASKMIAPIRTVTECMDILSTGDFRPNKVQDTLDMDRGDEIGAMSRAVKALRENVHEMVSKVVDSAEQVAAARVELTVTECTCTAFAKKHVAERVELAIDKESADVAEPFFDLFTLFVYINGETLAQKV